ncbi:EutN/CcmL family microcompartment protein [bacterium]|nr:EutN/CcmL family microcompartment protein [bacterium]
MKFGKIVGKVWATIKDPKLKGVSLKIMQPVNEHQQPEGNPVVAADTIGADVDDFVFWVASAEATTAFSATGVPCDASIVGFVDRVDL